MRRVTKLLKMIITGGFTMIISACYGPMVELKTARIRVNNSSGKPIPGLKISYKKQQYNTWSETDLTDENGESEFYTDSMDVTDFKIEDIDGTDNLGQFKTDEFSDSGEYIERILIEKPW